MSDSFLCCAWMCATMNYLVLGIRCCRTCLLHGHEWTAMVSKAGQDMCPGFHSKTRRDNWCICMYLHVLLDGILGHQLQGPPALLEANAHEQTEDKRCRYARKQGGSSGCCRACPGQSGRAIGCCRACPGHSPSTCVNKCIYRSC